MESIYRSALEYFSELLGRSIYAALAYGSRVAGYATEDSDYDIILVVEDYPSLVRYYYESVDGKPFSALVVDKLFFEEDVYHARHGEFVAGRLYTVFIPLINHEYIESLETALKKRTILEELCDLVSRYGSLMNYINIPLMYFLFSRLRRRMLAYPPVRYSYIKTFFGDRGKENIEASLKGFRVAAADLVRDGVLTQVGDDVFKLSSRDLSCPNRFLVRLRYLERGIKSYITHGRSARVPPKIFLQEFHSKIRRGVGGELPKPLKDPHILIHIDGVRVTSSTKNVYQALKSIFSDEFILVRRVKRTGLFSNTYIINIESGDGGIRRIVRKHFSYTDIFKWVLLQIWLIDICRFKISPSNRFINEVNYSLRIGGLGINTFKPLLFSWGDKSIYSMYINGVRVSELPLRYDKDLVLKIIYNIGYLLATLHGKGFRIGDLKPHNIIFDGDRLYLTDLEQFNEYGDPCWDIAEFIYYSYILTSKYKSVPIEEFIEAFTEGYKHGGGVDNLKRASSLKYLRPFLIISPWNRLHKIRMSLKKMST